MGDSGAVCIVSSVGSFGPNLPHDVVNVSSAPVCVPPLSAELPLLYSNMGHANPALRGLTAGHAHEGMPSSGFVPFLDVLPRGVFHPRGTRDGGVALIPMLTIRKKTAICLFCGRKKGFNHDGSAMVRTEIGLTPGAIMISYSCYLINR